MAMGLLFIILFLLVPFGLMLWALVDLLNQPAGGQVLVVLDDNLNGLLGCG